MSKQTPIPLSKSQSGQKVLALSNPIPDMLCVSMFAMLLPYIVQSIDPSYSQETVAFLSGILEFLALAIEIGGHIFWGFIGDKYGKKQAINCCIVLYIFGALVLGFATSIVHLVISKLLFGLGAGKIPNFKGYAHQVTDNTNIQEFYKYIGLMISITFFVGPILCGSLAYPNEKFGGIFSLEPFISKPYLLPVIVQQLLLSIIFCSISLYINQRNMLPTVSINQEEKTSLKEIFTRQYISACLTYALIGFVENAVAISYPMLCKTSIARGGVGWEDSFYASMTMSVGAIFLFLFQTFISPVLIHKLGVWQTIIILTGFVPFGTIILPLASNAHILVCILILTIGYILSYTMLISALLPINIAIINSVNHHHQGKANGFAMSLTGGVRAIGYFSYSLIYGWSVQNQMSFPFNASFSFIIIAVTSVGLLLMVIFSLSAKVNKRVEEDLLIMKIN